MNVNATKKTSRASTGLVGLEGPRSVNIFGCGNINIQCVRANFGGYNTGWGISFILRGLAPGLQGLVLERSTIDGASVCVKCVDLGSYNATIGTVGAIIGVVRLATTTGFLVCDINGGARVLLWGVNLCQISIAKYFIRKKRVPRS